MDIAHFKKIPIFAKLSDHDAEQIIDLLEHRNFAKGDFVIRQEAVGDGLHVITCGEAEILIDDSHVKTISVNDFFGEISLITDDPRSASVRVTSDFLSTMFLSCEAFDKVKNKIGSELMQEAVKRIRENIEQNRY